MLIQVDKLSINRREGRESGAKRAVQIIIRVLNGGRGVRTRRVTGKYPFKGGTVGQGLHKM